VGNYTVAVKHKPRYINEDLCTGCQDCISQCVFKEPKFMDEFNEGLGKRKPVYIPFPQATPQLVLIDPDVCSCRCVIRVLTRVERRSSAPPEPSVLLTAAVAPFRTIRSSAERLTALTRHPRHLSSETSFHSSGTRVTTRTPTGTRTTLPC
jgi:Fe-S-cluster-containing dehydrogenase component